MFRFNGIVLIAGLGVFTLAGGPALALTPPKAGAGPSLVVLMMDEEDMEVERDLEPDEVPKTKSGGEMVPVPDRAETSGGDVEDEEVKHDLETGD